MLREVSPDRLWISESPLRFYGIEMGTRMSVCRLSDGDLWVHSPLELDRGLRRTLDSLGQVRYVVSPNKLHHLFMGYTVSWCMMTHYAEEDRVAPAPEH